MENNASPFTGASSAVKPKPQPILSLSHAISFPTLNRTIILPLISSLGAAPLRAPLSTSHLSELHQRLLPLLSELSVLSSLSNLLLTSPLSALLLLRFLGLTPPVALGISICGHYVPQLSQIVYEKNKGISKPIINFKGYMPWLGGYDPCTEIYTREYYNTPAVQKAMHANVTGIPYAWETYSNTVGVYWSDSPSSMFPIYQELIDAGLRIWVFSGDTDSVVPLTSTRYSIDALNLPTTTSWYAWYDYTAEVGGWSQVYKGLTSLASVRGAGHEVPLHQPL